MNGGKNVTHQVPGKEQKDEGMPWVSREKMCNSQVLRQREIHNVERTSAASHNDRAGRRVFKQIAEHDVVIEL